MKEAIPESLKAALGFVDDSDQDHFVFISEWDAFLWTESAQSHGELPRSGDGTYVQKTRREIHPQILLFAGTRRAGAETPGAQLRQRLQGNRQGPGREQQPGQGQQRPREDGPNAKPSDRAEGQGQFDYLRRMGEEIASIDARLRSGVDQKQDNRNRNGIFAVGVLGSDRYDKFLILQALRPLLPNARFFTTDLDAIMLHPTALPHTRNLLIASSFALQLDERLQREIPAFRSSYQTAAFFATQAAVKTAVEDVTKASAKGEAKKTRAETDGVDRRCIWQEPPLLFEVGLSTLFQIPSAQNGKEAKPAAKNRNEPEYKAPPV